MYNHTIVLYYTIDTTNTILLCISTIRLIYNDKIMVVIRYAFYGQVSESVCALHTSF